MILLINFVSYFGFHEIQLSGRGQGHRGPGQRDPEAREEQATKVAAGGADAVFATGYRLKAKDRRELVGSPPVLGSLFEFEEKEMAD